MGDEKKPPRNTKLTQARRRLSSPSEAPRPMSRQELAEAVNAYVWEKHKRRLNLDENDIGKLERGEVRRPGPLRREAFRAVLRVATDAELGFYIKRDRESTDADESTVGDHEHLSGRDQTGVDQHSSTKGTKISLGDAQSQPQRQAVVAAPTLNSDDPHLRLVVGGQSTVLPIEAVAGRALREGRGKGHGGRALFDVISTDDERAYELFIRGYGLLGANDRREIETAQELLERAVGRNPRFARAIAARGYTRWRQYFAGWVTNAQALTNALRDVDAALDADPDSVFAHMTFIRTCWDLGWHEQALQAGKSIYERSPESLDATVAFARALTNAGLAQCALPLVDSVLAVDPTNPAALKLRAWCRLMIGDHAHVLKIAREYLAKHPTDANTRWAVALACQNVPGGGDEAIRIAGEALAADPVDVTLWVLLGYLYRMNGDAASARKVWSQGLERLRAEAPDASNWRRKAWVANAEAAVGDSESALRTVQELSEADPENGYLRYRLGHVLAEMGHLGEAVRMIESAVRHGFLSVQLLRQEEVLALSRLRELDDYAGVVQRQGEGKVS